MFSIIALEVLAVICFVSAAIMLAGGNIGGWPLALIPIGLACWCIATVIPK